MKGPLDQLESPQVIQVALALWEVLMFLLSPYLRFYFQLAGPPTCITTSLANCK
jgi:hypothetical protein